MINLLKVGMLVGAAMAPCMTTVVQAQTPAPVGRYASAGMFPVTDGWKNDPVHKSKRMKDQHIVVILDTLSGQLIFCGDDSKDCETTKPR